MLVFNLTENSQYIHSSLKLTRKCAHEESKDGLKWSDLCETLVVLHPLYSNLRNMGTEEVIRNATRAYLTQYYPQSLSIIPEEVLQVNFQQTLLTLLFYQVEP